MADTNLNASQILDGFVSQQASNMDACYQQMQGMDDLIRELQAASSPGTSEVDTVLENVLGDVKNIGESVAKLLIEGAEMTALAGLEVGLALSTAVAGFFAIPIAYFFGKPGDVEKTKQALGITLSPATVLSTIYFQARNNDNLERSSIAGPKYGKEFDALKSLASSIASPAQHPGNIGSLAKTNLASYEGMEAASELAKPLGQLSTAGTQPASGASRVSTALSPTPDVPTPDAFLASYFAKTEDTINQVISKKI